MLTGKTALVTGAGRHIGKGIAETFADHGATVVVNDVDAERADAVVDGLASDDDQEHLALVADGTDAEAVESAALEIERAAGGLDVLVNNLGYAANEGVFDVSVEEWHRVLDLCLTSGFLWTKYAGALIVEGGDGGAIVNLASMLGHRGATDKVAYCAAKGGVLNMTRQLALDLAAFDVRVNSISPGLVGDPVGMDSGREERDTGRIPLGRLGEPDDVGNLALFLVSDLADYVTGVDVPLDGGMFAGTM